MSQYILLEESELDFEYMESSDHYQRVEAMLPEGVKLNVEITPEDLAFGIANATPVML